MKSQLIGTQTFLFVNYLFRNNPHIEGVIAPVMMQVNEEKIEINYIGMEVIEQRSKYLNYHKTHKGLLAMKIWNGE